MLETKTYQPSINLVVSDLTSCRLELSRLLAAAVVNQQFCQLLLDDPALALETGFQGESFTFTPDERQLIESICAVSLTDLAGQLMRSFIEPVTIKGNRPVQPAGFFGC
jgi:hypothetical protein